MKFIALSEQSNLSENPSEVRTHWNGFIRWVTFEVFKLKGLSEQVRNDYIRGAEERLETRLVKEAEEKSLKEAEEKARLDAGENVVAESTAAVEAEAKAKVNAEEAACIAAE